MTTHLHMATRRCTATRLVGLGALLSLLVLDARAAGTGGLGSAGLFADAGATSTGAPAPVVSHNFAGTGALSGVWPDVGPGPWTVRSGTFTRTGGAVTNGGGTNRWATLPTGSTVQRVRVGISFPATHTIGVVAKASPSATTYLRALKNDLFGGRLLLQRVVSGTATTLASLVGVGNASPGVLTLVVAGASVSVHWGGFTLTHTLSVADQATFGPLTHAGLFVTGTPAGSFLAPFRVWSS